MFPIKVGKTVFAVFLSVALILLSSPARAQMTPYQTAEQTYLARLDSYRTSQTNFQTAKQKNQSYNTLASQSAAINSGRDYLNSQIDLVAGYLDLVIEKANETTSISSTDKDYIVNFYTQDKAYYAGKRVTVTNAGSSDDLKAVGDDLRSHLKSDTLATMPFIKILITSNQYRSFLEQITISLEDTKKLAAGESFLSSTTTDLISDWIAEADDKIRQSNELLKDATTNIIFYKENSDTLSANNRYVSKANDDLTKLWENLINHANNITEILGRLKNG